MLTQPRLHKMDYLVSDIRIIQGIIWYLISGNYRQIPWIVIFYKNSRYKRLGLKKKSSLFFSKTFLFLLFVLVINRMTSIFGTFSRDLIQKKQNTVFKQGSLYTSDPQSGCRLKILGCREIFKIVRKFSLNSNFFWFLSFWNEKTRGKCVLCNNSSTKNFEWNCPIKYFRVSRNFSLTVRVSRTKKMAEHCYIQSSLFQNCSSVLLHSKGTSGL